MPSVELKKKSRIVFRNVISTMRTKEDYLFSREDYLDNSDKLEVGKKRKATETVEQPSSEDVMMSLSKRRQCSGVLKRLRSHTYGWAFNEPVDPVKLQIPDYFSIIKKPMDLGTIQRKLEKQLYTTTSKFAADVRLTFSNAMRYNPPGNFVHEYAKTLNRLFDTSWKGLELKWGKISATPEVQPTDVAENHSQNTTKVPNYGIGRIRLKIPRVNEDTQKNNNLPVSAENHRPQQAGSIQVSTGDLNFKKSSAGENIPSHSNTSNLTNGSCEIPGPGPQECKKTITEKKCYSGSDSSDSATFDGDVLPNNPISVAIPTTPLKDKDSPPPFEEQLSPTKALRAALLRSRFKDTILKAQIRHPDNVEKVDPITIQREKENFEKKQQEEIARLKQLQVEEAAQRAKEATALKRQKAREELERMERNVIQWENTWVLKDLDRLGCLHPVYTLEKLGLFRKDDF